MGSSGGQQVSHSQTNRKSAGLPWGYLYPKTPTGVTLPNPTEGEGMFAGYASDQTDDNDDAGDDSNTSGNNGHNNDSNHNSNSNSNNGIQADDEGESGGYSGSSSLHCRSAIGTTPPAIEAAPGMLDACSGAVVISETSHPGTNK